MQDDWFNDLKTLLTMVGVDEKQTVFYFQHTQILNEKLKEEANSIDEVIHLIEFINNI